MAWFRSNAWKAITALLALYAGSVVVPAVTQQWGDRARDSDLKRSLVTEISRSAADTINTARFIAGDVLPEAAARARAERRFTEAQRRNKPKEEQELRAAYDRALDAEERAEQKAYNTVKNEWIKTGATVEAELDAYFPDTTLGLEWHKYYTHVVTYVRLASTLCKEGRTDVVTELERYFTEVSLSDVAESEWDDLKLKGRKCDPKGKHFQASYTKVGDVLLDRREKIVQQIVAGNSPAYSVGRADLFRAITFR